MLRALFFLCTFITTFTFAQEESKIMYRFDNDANDECGYINQDGDTLVPFGECVICFTDSMNYAIVIKWEDKGGPGFLAINSQGNEIFRVFIYDNGPDYIKDGTMRIIKDGKIGYATESGDVIISPVYEGAWPFENGRALVSLKTTKKSDGEHSWWEGGDWFYIDKNGDRHENQSE